MTPRWIRRHPICYRALRLQLIGSLCAIGNSGCTEPYGGCAQRCNMDLYACIDQGHSRCEPAHGDCVADCERLLVWLQSMT